MVGFPDFIYKNIVPACFLAPLKPTFDLSDAQTVLVSSQKRGHDSAASGGVLTVSCSLADAVRVRAHTENDSPEEGKAAAAAAVEVTCGSGSVRVW